MDKSGSGSSGLKPERRQHMASATYEQWNHCRSSTSGAIVVVGSSSCNFGYSNGLAGTPRMRQGSLSLLVRGSTDITRANAPVGSQSQENLLDAMQLCEGAQDAKSERRARVRSWAFAESMWPVRRAGTDEAGLPLHSDCGSRQQDESDRCCWKVNNCSVGAAFRSGPAYL